MTLTITKTKRAGEFQVLITVVDDISKESVSAFTDILSANTLETAINNATWSQIKTALSSSYEGVIIRQE